MVRVHGPQLARGDVGVDDVDPDAGAQLDRRRHGQPRPDLHVPVEGFVPLERCRVQDGVPGKALAEDGAQAAGGVQERVRQVRRGGRLAGMRLGRDPELVGEPAPARRERPQPVGAADRAPVLVAECGAQGALAGERRQLIGDRRGDVVERHELGVGVVERGACRRALVDRRQQVGGADGAMVLAANLPGDERLAHHLVGQLGERRHMGGSVDHDLLARDGRELVRDDAHRPSGRVGLRDRAAEGEHLGRCHRLVALAERAGGRVGDAGRAAERTRAGRPARSDDDRYPREGAAAQVERYPASPPGRSARSRSSGTGRIVAVLFVPEISSSVCR